MRRVRRSRSCLTAAASALDFSASKASCICNYYIRRNKVQTRDWEKKIQLLPFWRNNFEYQILQRMTSWVSHLWAHKPFLAKQFFGFRVLTIFVLAKIMMVQWWNTENLDDLKIQKIKYEQVVWSVKNFKPALLKETILDSSTKQHLGKQP